MSYNLDDVPEHFTFTLKGIEYRMVYPTTEQIAEVAKLEDDKDLSEVEKAKKQTEYFNKFITPVKEDGLNLEENMKNISIKQIQRFNQMLKVELSIE